MDTLKEKASNQLSRVFADSTTSSPSSPTSPPPPSDSNSQASPPSTGKKSFSSYITSFIPPLRFGWPKSNKHHRGLRSIQSLPNDFDKDLLPGEEYKARYYDCLTSVDEEFLKYCEDEKQYKMISENKKTIETHVASKDPALLRSKSDGEVFEEAIDQLTPRKSLAYPIGDSDFISSELYEFLQSSLPNSVKGLQWVLIYSTLRDGISLRTLIRKSVDHSGPCLLVVGDRQGAVFGGLLECPLRPTGKRKYQGTNQTFVFTTLYKEPRLFRATGANRYYYICLNDLLAFGGGGNFALHLDGDLLNGTSGPSDTFGNECLAHDTEFELKNVELWGFTYSSRYLA